MHLKHYLTFLNFILHFLIHLFFIHILFFRLQIIKFILICFQLLFYSFIIHHLIFYFFQLIIRLFMVLKHYQTFLNFKLYFLNHLFIFHILFFRLQIINFILVCCQLFFYSFIIHRLIIYSFRQTFPNFILYFLNHLFIFPILFFRLQTIKFILICFQ